MGFAQNTTEKGIPPVSYDRVAEPVLVDTPAHLRASFLDNSNPLQNITMIAFIFSELLFLTMRLPILLLNSSLLQPLP